MFKSLLVHLVLGYFRFFARLKLRHNPRAIIIGITGSAGKTSARLALVAILRSRGIVKHSSHANSESGIPLNILGLSPTTYSPLDWFRLMILAPFSLLWREHFDYYVVEMGIDSPHSPKNMSYLLSIVRPHSAIILNAGLSHAANFDHLIRDLNPARRATKIVAHVAREKFKLAEAIPKRGTVVMNYDQAEFRRLRPLLKSRLTTFGKGKGADLCLLKTSSSIKSGFHLRFRYLGHLYQLDLPDFYPEHYGLTFLSVIALASSLGIPPSLSLPRLSEYRSPAGRMRIFQGIKDTTIIDSSYNASPTSMFESLDLLKKVGKDHYKLAVIGDMNELGLSTKLAHKHLADQLMDSVDEVILFGDLTLEHTLPVLKAAKFPVHHFKKMTSLISHLRTSLKPSSYVLLKGSQNQIYLERAVEALLADKADVVKLCRRGMFWDRRRRLAP